MNTSKVRLKTYIELDSITEKDMLNRVNSMIEDRQLSGFVTSCVKYVLDNPSKQEIVNKRRSDDSERKEFFSELDKRASDIEKCLSDLNEELVKLKGFISLNKMIGMSDKVDNLLCAELLLKKQVRSLNSSLGRIGIDLDKTSVKDDFDAQSERAEDILAFAIEHYDGVVQELKVMTAPKEIVTTTEIVKRAEVAEPVTERNASESKPEVKKDTEEKLETVVDANDAVKNMSDEDFDAMSAFFGL